MALPAGEVLAVEQGCEAGGGSACTGREEVSRANGRMRAASRNKRDIESLRKEKKKSVGIDRDDWRRG
jgi:hypothetical protein